jgi:hypothetical protein
MIGQPQLREKLALPQLEQLRQRITVSYHLQPLDAEETANYINHRLKRAAIGTPVEFPRDVTDLINRRSHGVPRIINVIADATLLFAYGVDRRDIDLVIAEDALAELDVTGILASYDAEAVESATASSVSVADAQEALRMAEEAHKREKELAQRERQVAQREQALAAQQRIFAEEARLLETSRRLASATTFSSSVPARPAQAGRYDVAPSPVVNTFVPAATPSPVARIITDTGLRVQAYTPPPTPTMWERVRRALFGAFSTQPEA